jgi:hypothetical protein
MISSRNLEQLPAPTELRRLLKSLAVLDAILSPEWEYRYYSYNRGWSPETEMGSMRNGSGDHWFALFTHDGAGIVGLAHEAPMFRPGEPLEGMFDGLPGALAELRSEPAFDAGNCSFCLWSLGAEGAWRRGAAPMPVGDDPDGSASLLGLLDRDPRSYIAFASDYYDADIPLDSVQAIYDHAPLSASLVSSLNQGVSVGDLEPDLAEIGYPWAPPDPALESTR